MKRPLGDYKDVLELRESNAQAPTLLIDLSYAGNSARACQMIEDFLPQLSEHPAGSTIDLNVGDLLLTKGVLVKIRQLIHRSNAQLGIVYATVPQTQQAALDEGLFVKEKLVSQSGPLRQPLPLQNAPKFATPPGSDRSNPRPGVNLPDFSQPRPVAAAPKVVDDFRPVAPQTLEVPELSDAQAEEEATPDVEPTVEQAVTSQPAEAVESDALPTQEVEFPDTAFDTLYLRQTLRSGQTVRFNGNVIIVGDVHAGSEVTAGGDIVVWGELRGIAHAGAQGNYKSEIRAMKIEALQLRIADYIARRPDRIYYHKDGAETVISPEAARVADGEIKIFKTALTR